MTLHCVSSDGSWLHQKSFNLVKKQRGMNTYSEFLEEVADFVSNLVVSVEKKNTKVGDFNSFKVFLGCLVTYLTYTIFTQSLIFGEWFPLDTSHFVFHFSTPVYCKGL